MSASSIQKSLCVILLVVVLSAQTPAPALPSTPLRHLEYSYSVDYQSLGSQDTGAIGTTVRAGMESYSYGTGRQGKLLVDVLAAAKDGGLVIRVAEWIQNQPRPQQSYVCAVYPDTSVSCPSTLPVTDVETTMLGFLGRRFVNPSLIDNNQWDVHYSNKAVAVATQYTVVSTDTTGKLISVEGQSTAKSIDGTHPDWLEKIAFVYDLSKEVPTEVDDFANETVRGPSSYKSHMHYVLTTDSLTGAQR